MIPMPNLIAIRAAILARIVAKLGLAELDCPPLPLAAATVGGTPPHPATRAASSAG